MISRVGTGILLVLTCALACAAPLGPDREPGRIHPGKFVWFDLGTDDPDGASYCFAAAGWTSAAHRHPTGATLQPHRVRAEAGPDAESCGPRQTARCASEPFVRTDSSID